MKVLIAVEDEVYGNLLADFVGKHIWPTESTFKVLHVIEPILLDHGGDVSFAPLLESTATQVVKQAGDLVSKVVSRLRENLDEQSVSQDIVEGHAAARILDVAHTWGADLIVVGSHGRHGMTRFVLGSVSAAVVSNANCSVAVMRLPAKLKPEEKVAQQS